MKSGVGCARVIADISHVGTDGETKIGLSTADDDIVCNVVAAERVDGELQQGDVGVTGVDGWMGTISEALKVSVVSWNSVKSKVTHFFIKPQVTGELDTLGIIFIL